MSAKIAKSKRENDETIELLDSEQEENRRETHKNQPEGRRDRKVEAEKQQARKIENTGPRNRREEHRSRREVDEDSSRENRSRREESREPSRDLQEGSRGESATEPEDSTKQTKSTSKPSRKDESREPSIDRRESVEEPLLSKEKRSDSAKHQESKEAKSSKTNRKEESREPSRDRRESEQGSRRESVEEPLLGKEKHIESASKEARTSRTNRKEDTKDTREEKRHKRQVESTPNEVETLPPLAKGETDEEDDREVVSKPYPGVDDGFFESKDPKHDSQEPKVDSQDPKHDSKDDEADEKPQIEDRSDTDSHDVPPSSRGGPDGGSGKPDETDGGRPEVAHPNFHDLELGGIIPDLDSIPDVNVYQHKKTLAQGMMDLALFSANANQLRYVLESSTEHPYFYPSVVLISISLVLQVAVGIGLIWNAAYNVKDDKEICHANRISNFTIIGIFLVTVVNVFISAFGIASPTNGT